MGTGQQGDDRPTLRWEQLEGRKLLIWPGLPGASAEGLSWDGQRTRGDGVATATVTEQLEEEMPSPGTTNQGTGDVQCVRGASAKRVHESALGGRPIGWSWPGALAEMRLWSHKVSLLGSQRGRGRPLSWTEVSLPRAHRLKP